VFLFSILIVWKIWVLQFIEGKQWKIVAQKNSIRAMKVRATRGNIYSDNGSLLATSLPFYRVAIDPVVAKKEVFNTGIDSLALMLSKQFPDKSKKEYLLKIKNARAKGKRYLILTRHMINYQVKKAMTSWPIIREGRKGGVIFEKMDRRYRPFSELAFRTIGFVNQDYQGAGLEYSFNSQLAGKDGEAIFTKIAGAWKPLHDESEIQPEQGYDIQTTININLQDVAEAALEKHLKMHKADYGCVVLMEVNTGEIKAIANLTMNRDSSYSENYNYAVASSTDPGSTFKLASMIALFEDSDVELDHIVQTGNGKIQFYDRIMTDSKPGGYGPLTVKQAFAKSSNVAVSRMIFEHFKSTPEKYIEYIKQMKLDQPLGFQMQGEAIPYIKNPKDTTWSGVTMPWMSIGYEMKVSPLHILSLYNAVANNAKMIVPIIVKNTNRADKILEEYQARVIEEKICSDKTLQKVKVLLEAVVEEGTAQNIKNPDYKIAGKTGTAQKIKNGAYTKNYYTSFAGYFPAEKPKYSCIVVIDSPKGFHLYGGDVSAPVFKEIADKIYAQDPEMHKVLKTEKAKLTNNQALPKLKPGSAEDLKLLCNQLGVSNHGTDQDEWVEGEAKNKSIAWKNREVREGLVPNVIGMSIRDALYLLENNGLRVTVIGRGKVVSQSVIAGDRAIKGNGITIVLE
jgi:cell division protein FtsI (penicillin-binding protein 3)